MREVVIASYLRTAQSRSRRLDKDPERDWFYKMSGDELLAALLPEILKRAQVDSEEVDDFLVGSAFGINEQWTYGGRTPIFLANLSEKIPAKFIDQQCASAMASLHIGFLEIAAGFADIVLAGGFEHMTRVPNSGPTMEKEHVKLNPRLYTDKSYQHWDMPVSLNMGLTAEKLFSQTGLTREELDQWGARSHQLAEQAQKEGFFDDEILPLECEQADGTKMVVDKDQSVRANVSVEAMAGLRPAFKPDGVITAGNASPLNAGATSMLLMAKEVAEKRGLKPMATIRSLGFAGVDPTIMGVGPVPAVQKALRYADLSAGDIDYWEINEAFCVVALHAIKELGLNPDRVNVMGGGTAIGHPLGATGIRLVGTLARILDKKSGRYGCATACVGGGQGTATIIEREPNN